MAYIEKREQAMKLRHNGKSIIEITERLNMSKSTVSYWCRDVVLKKEQMRALVEKQKIGGAFGRLRAAEKKRAARIEAVEKESSRGAQDVGKLSGRDVYIFGLALYWGEGYKSGNEECGFTNSNSHIIQAYITWLKQAYGIKKEDLILRISINETHKSRIRKVEQYWSQLTNIPRNQFTSTSLIKSRSKKTYSNPQGHFGTLRIKVRRGTSLRRRIMGSLKEIAKQLTQ